MSRTFESTVFYTMDVLRNVLLEMPLRGNGLQRTGGGDVNTNFTVRSMKFNKMITMITAKQIFHHTSNSLHTLCNNGISPRRVQDQYLA